MRIILALVLVMGLVGCEKAQEREEYIGEYIRGAGGVTKGEWPANPIGMKGADLPPEIGVWVHWVRFTKYDYKHPQDNPYTQDIKDRVHYFYTEEIDRHKLLKKHAQKDKMNIYGEQYSINDYEWPGKITWFKNPIIYEEQ